MSSELQHITDIPAYIFGEGSSLCSQCAVAAQNVPTPLWFLGFAALLCVVYLVWVNHWILRGGEHSFLFLFLGRHHGDYDEKFEDHDPAFATYIHSGALLGFLTIWIMLLVYTSLYLQPSYLLMATLMAGIFLVYIFQIIAIKAIGIISGYPEFMQMAETIKAIFFSILALIATPTVLCYALTRGEVQNIFAYIIAIQVVVLLGGFLYETFLLFLTKKVSVLHTILYLCAVEIFPVTLIWGFFGR